MGQKILCFSFFSKKSLACVANNKKLKFSGSFVLGNLSQLIKISTNFFRVNFFNFHIFVYFYFLPNNRAYLKKLNDHRCIFSFIFIKSFFHLGVNPFSLISTPLAVMSSAIDLSKESMRPAMLSTLVRMPSEMPVNLFWRLDRVVWI